MTGICQKNEIYVTFNLLSLDLLPADLLTFIHHFVISWLRRGGEFDGEKNSTVSDFNECTWGAFETLRCIEGRKY